MGIRRGKGCGQVCAVDADVDVAGAGDLKFFKAGISDSGEDLFGDLARSLAQLLREFKGEGKRVLAELDFWRLLDHDVRRFPGRRCAGETRADARPTAVPDVGTRMSSESLAN